MYGSLHLSGRTWHLSDLPPHVSLKFKSMFARVAKTQAGAFTLANTPDVCADLVWFMERYPLLMDDASRQRLEDGHREANEIAAFADSVLAGGWTPSPIIGFRENRPPYPYQAQAAAIATRLHRLLLMDDVGLGKTISAIAGVLQSRSLPAAIVVQAHLADQWAVDYIEAFTTCSVHVIKGTRPYALPPADFYIFRYSNIAGWVDIAATGMFRAIVFDEIQELRHGIASQKGQAARVFAQNATLRLGLTATPIYNYGSEIYNVVQFLEPGALGDFSEFTLEWCAVHGTHWIVKDPPALGAFLREQTIGLRRVETDVGAQMPPVNVLMHEVPFDEAVAEAVATEARQLALKIVKGSFAERGQAARDLDMLARHSTGMAKAKGVAALVRMLVEAGKHVLVAGWHRDVYDVWTRQLADLDPLMFTGTESPAAKRRNRAAFMKGPARPMFMSLRSGAGLDGLQDVCSTAVIGEFDWSPQVHKQFIGRLRRPGQKLQVDAIYAHTNGGSDPVLIEMLGLKASQSHGIVDPFTAASAVHSDDTRMRKLAEAYLARTEGRT